MAQSITQTIWGSPSRVPYEAAIIKAKKAGNYPVSTDNVGPRNPRHTPVSKQDREAVKARIIAFRMQTRFN